jgi:hypothetical protein
VWSAYSGSRRKKIAASNDLLDMGCDPVMSAARHDRAGEERFVAPSEIVTLLG